MYLSYSFFRLYISDALSLSQQFLFSIPEIFLLESLCFCSSSIMLVSLVGTGNGHQFSNECIISDFNSVAIRRLSLKSKVRNSYPFIFLLFTHIVAICLSNLQFSERAKVNFFTDIFCWISRPAELVTIVMLLLRRNLIPSILSFDGLVFFFCQPTDSTCILLQIVLICVC